MNYKRGVVVHLGPPAAMNVTKKRLDVARIAIGVCARITSLSSNTLPVRKSK